ncbi:hypothetical protein QOZ80_7AG0573490 [Eleusine coracana subsp. coracana]|nr:hypothetical protein QOZ80_7AG0573490 [Eleusine coracana subsp. coracana]
MTMRVPRCWRDWTNLGEGPTGLIADRLLANDVADYVRFRAVCAPWRACSDDPRSHSVFDRQYHPHQWIISVQGWRQSLLNVSTGEIINMRQPYCRNFLLLGPTAEGLLLLCQKSTLIVQLFNPLTGQLIDLPCADTLTKIRYWRMADNLAEVRRLKVLGAGMAGDSMVAVLFRGCDERQNFYDNDFTRVAVARPGDKSWIRLDTVDGIVSALPFTGRFYCATSKNIMVLQQATASQKPQLVVAADYEFDTSARSYICLADNKGELILIRCYPIFHGLRHKMREVYRVDLDAGKTLAVTRVDGHAVFVGPQCGHALSVRAGLSPSIRANTIYFCRRHQTACNPSGLIDFDIWRVIDGTVMEDGRTKGPPCSVVEHLASYILG